MSRIFSRLWLSLSQRFARRPAPKPIVALYLALRWRAHVALSADITYPFQLQLGSDIILGKCKINCTGKITLSNNVCIHDGVILDAGFGEVLIEERVVINSYCVVNGSGGLYIGRDTGIAVHTTIMASNHGIDDLNLPMMQQPLRRIGISIAENVWIGANCVILDGVTIGSGAVIAAGAVVTHDVATEDIVAGVPAKVIRNRRTITSSQT